MAKMALMEDDPPDGYEEDIPPDGYEDNAKPDMVQPKATPKASSIALDAYIKGLDAYIAGDRENAVRMAREALRFDPTMVEAQRMLERFKVSPNAGTTPVDFPTSLPVHKIENRFSSIAPLATKIVQSATPPSNIRKIIRSPLDVPLETAKRAVRVGEAIDKSPVTKTVGAGNARLLAQAARVPNLAANIFALPYNAAVQVAGRGDLAQASPRLFEKEATWWDEKAAQLSEGNKRWGEKGEDFLTVVKRRNPKEISQYIAYKVLEEAPQQAIVIGTTLAGMPTSALAYMGVSSAAQSQAEGEGRTNPAAVTANAVINGTLEAALERTPALLGKWSKALEGSFGNKGKLEILKNVAKTITSSMIQEGPVEEGSTEFLQSLAKMATGVDPNAMRGVGGRMIEASTIGAAMGGGMTAPAAIGAGIARSMDSQAQNGQPVAPLDTNGIPAYPSLHGQPTVGSDVAGGGVSPGSVTPAIQTGGDDVGPPDGFVDDVGGPGPQALQPQGQTNTISVVPEQVPPTSPGMDVAPTPDVPNVGQGTPPQGEPTAPPVEQEPPSTTEPIKSKGHVLFFTRPDGTKAEVFFKEKGGDVYTAPISDVIDTETGNRFGRFEVPNHMADQFIRSIAIPTAPSSTAETSPAPTQQTDPPVTQPTKKTGHKPIKQFKPIEGLASLIPKRTTLPILKGMNVVNGMGMVTNLKTWLETKVDLPDGHYKMVGKNTEKTNEKQDDFPVRPGDGTKIGTVDRSDLIRNFVRVNKALPDDETRYVLTGVNLSVTNGKASLVATDGRRLSMSPLDTAKLSDGSYIIPNANGFEKAIKALDDGPLDVAVVTDEASKTQSMISFSSPNGRVVSRLVDGKFPSVDQVIPEPTEQIVFSKAVLENALKEIAPYVKESGSPSVIIDRDGDNYSVIVPKTAKTNGKTIIIKAKAVKGNYGKINAGSIVMPMQLNEHFNKIGFTPSKGFIGGFDLGYLHDAVASVSGNDVYLGRTEDYLNPVVVRGKPFDPKTAEAKQAKAKRGRGAGKSGQASTGGEGIEKFESSRRIDQTETPEFKKWFGDSVVTDTGELMSQGGKPLVVYHGTASVFDKFSTKALGKSTDAVSARAGFWFVSRPDVAEGYGIYAANTAKVGAVLREADRLERKAQRTGKKEDWAKHQEKIEEAERLERNLGEFGIGNQNIMPVFLVIKNPSIFDAEGEGYFGKEHSITRFVLESKKKGHDGVIVKNLDDSAAGGGGKVGDHYIVFAPNQIKSATGNTGAFDSENPSILKSPEGPTSQSRRIETFEKLTPNEQDQEFKLFDKVHGLVKKYAGLVGERYLPRQTSGVYYPKTTNIRLKSLNELSVAVHEITHAIDAKVGLSDKLNASREWDVVGGLTEVYTEMYPSGKSDHPVKKRIVEGLATLIQKTAEMPSAMEYKYGDLVKMFTKPGGKHYVKEFDMLLQDTKEIVRQFQQLDALQQVGAFVTENIQQKEARDSFLGARDKIRTETSDAVWPIEKASTIGGIDRTSDDPSLWARAYQGSSGIVLANMVGKKGFWIPNARGGFNQVSPNNLGDMVDGLKKRGMIERFGWWLLARDTTMAYKLLDEMEVKAIEAAKKLEEAKRIISEMGPGGMVMAGRKDLRALMQGWKQDIERFEREKGILSREPLARKTWEEAYGQNVSDFQEDARLFDVFTKANVDLLQMSGLITPEQVAELREGYAPKKRDIYDDILGAERAQMPAVMVGKNKVSSMMARKGSSLTYLNPVYSVIKDHAEIVKKSLRQMVYNKIRDLKTVLPGVIHELELNVIVDKDTGRISFPQEKDPNIVMARDVDGGRHPLLVGKDLKNVIDDILQFHQMNVFERVVRYSAQMFSQLTTSTYPPFVLTNLAMDIPTAIANTRTKMVPVYDAIRELSKALMDKTSKEHEYAQEWFASHGERQSLAGWQTLDPEDFYRLLVNEKHWLIRATKKAVGAVDVLSTPGKYSEIMSRLTEYIRSRKAGKPWIVAMEDSARVTTPFSHMGRWGGGTWGKTLIRSIAFMNPGIQALDQFTRTAGNKGTRHSLLFVMAATIAASTGGLAWIMKQGSDEQKDRYKDLEGKMLTNYVWFPSPDGKSLIKVRVAEQYGWLAALTNLAIGETIFNTDYKFRDYVDGATSWVPDQFDITNPVMALMSWIPQVVKSPVEVAFDKRTFPNLRPLTPMSVKHLPPGERTIETTSTFAKKIGKFLDLSPIAIDHIIEGYLGRTARFATGRIFNMKLNPFAQDWYFTSGRNIQDFYETRERAKYLEQSFRTGERNLTKSELSELRHNVPRIQEIEKRLSIIRKYDKAGKSLKGDELYKNRKEILTLIGELK